MPSFPTPSIGPRARIAVISLIVVCAASSSQTAAGVSRQSVERRVIVSAVDDDGAPVRGLMPRDFVVREDGVRREVLRVDSRVGPRQLALLVDTSAAATRATVDLRHALSAFVEALASEDELALIGFGGPPRILVAPTDDHAAVLDGIRRLFAFPDSGAYLLDAIDAVLDGFDRRQAAQPVIIVVSALGPEYSSRFARPLIDRMMRAGVALYAVAITEGSAGPFGTGADPQRQIEHERILSQGADMTGGRRLDLLSSMAIDDALVRIARELQSQYTVVYARPDAFVPPRRIEVDVSRGDVDARAITVREE